MGTDGKGGFCAWASDIAGFRLTLPTEAQFEYAARGGQSGLAYPWGDTFDQSKLLCSGTDVGDAAKVVSPFGARGGNSGIADADNLAWKLAAVLRGQATPKLLDSYHAERHQAATENVRVTRRTNRFLRPGSATERLFRHAAITLAQQQPFARALVNTGRMAVANTYTRSPVCVKGAPHAGESVQNAPFRWGDGSTPGCLNDLLGWAKAHPGQLILGSTGIGTTAHLAMEEILLQHNVKYVHVPYKGTADQMLAIAGAQIMAGVNSTGFAPWVDRGQMRLLATFNAARNPRWPDAPTLRELGYPQAVYTSPWGLAAPAGTPPAFIQKLHDAFHKAMLSPRHTEALARYDQSLDYLNTRDYRQAVLVTVEREKKLLARMNLLAPPKT